ncbi:hypothetical protein BC830DRAFT_673747 [Chytriomyces sp. MP71]|nr:hypothetical protein BC830DRAFT_673747 [Chytriomyces sp. MP71]
MGKKKKGQKQPPSTGYSAPELPDAEAPILAEPILKHSNNDLGTTESLRASRALDADGTRPALDVELTRENVEAEFDIELDEGNAHDEPGFNGNLEDLHANEETEEEGVFALEEVEHSTVEVAATTSSPRVPPPPESRQRSQVISMDYQENVSLSEAAFNVSKLSHALPTLPPSNVANRRKARSRPVANHSIISQIGSLVKGTISHGTTSTSPVNAIPTTLNGPESIFFAKFVHLFCWDADAGGVNIADFTDDGNLCLVLGYERGFQIWSASSNGGNEFSQIASVRAGLSKIVDADVVSNSVSEIQREAIENHVAKECPIIVL